MNRIVRGFLAATALVALVAMAFSCSSLGLGGDKGSSVLASGDTTDFIAGDGRGNGPGNGDDTGDITFTQTGDNLNIAIDMDDAANWSLGGLHIYLGDGVPTNGKGKPTVAPGQFPFTAADGTWNVNGDQWNGNFDISQFDDPFTIAIHGTGLEGSSDGIWQTSLQGQSVNTYVLYYGANDIAVGTVTMMVVGLDIKVNVTVNSPYLITEAHLWLEEAGPIPPFAPGQWPYNSGIQNPGVTSYTFTVPLSTFGITQGDPVAGLDLSMAFHASIKNANGGGSESATAWNADCRTHFLQGGKDGNKPHWKSWTTCADLGAFTWQWVPGTDGREETLWGMANPNDPFEGWFPNNGFNRWGWFITYDPN